MTDQAEVVFSTARLEAVFLSPAMADEADKVIMAAPKFYQGEFEADPEPGFIAELLEAPPPPGVSKVAVFPIGLREKGKAEFVGVAHMVLGYPTETTLFVGMIVFSEAVQKKGFGKELLTGLYDWARPQGVDFVRIRVHPRHTEAGGFLDKMGYVDLPNKLSTGHAVWERKVPATED